MNKNQKIVKYPGGNGFHFSLVIFILIIIYLLVNIFLYVTGPNVSVYEVKQGTIAANNIYKGLIIRSEEIVYADQTGYVDYYWKGGEKASVVDNIYSVDTKGTLAKQIQDAPFTLGSSDINEISTLLGAFHATYNSNEFFEARDLKENLDSTITQAVNLSGYAALSEEIHSAEAGNLFSLKRPPKSGIVMYDVDGYEGITLENYNSSCFDMSNYKKETLNTREQINSGDPAYKLITSEKWYIVVPVAKKLAEELSVDDVMKIRFCKDGNTAVCTYTISNRDNQYFVNLALTNSMIRYGKERFMNVELLLSNQKGLKIPNSSITTKDFFTVPREAFSGGGDQNEPTLLIQSREDPSKVDMITPTVYYATDQYYYIDSGEVDAKDVVVYPDSTKTYTIGEDIGTLEGVYNVNKGYAVFKQINILYQNEEYSIVETGTAYGITVYDHIALEGDSIKEEQLLTR